MKGKVCLAYSGQSPPKQHSNGRLNDAFTGGLDTSTILKWLLEAGHEVVCFLADGKRAWG